MLIGGSRKSGSIPCQLRFPCAGWVSTGRAISPSIAPVFPLYTPCIPPVITFYFYRWGLQGDYRGITGGIEGDYWGISWGYADGLGLSLGGFGIWAHLDRLPRGYGWATSLGMWAQR